MAAWGEHRSPLQNTFYGFSLSLDGETAILHYEHEGPSSHQPREPMIKRLKGATRWGNLGGLFKPLVMPLASAGAQRICEVFVMRDRSIH